MINRLKVRSFLVAFVLITGALLEPATIFAQAPQSLSGRIGRLNHLKMRVEKMNQADSRLCQLADKLGQRINSLVSQGKDVSLLQNMLNNLKSKLSDAGNQYSAADSLLDKITPSEPSFKDELTQVKSEIKAGAADLKSARIDVRKIRQSLKSI